MHAVSGIVRRGSGFAPLLMDEHFFLGRLHMMSSKPQSQRSSKAQGKSAGAERGTHARNKNELKSDRDNTLSIKAGANKDQFGSGHNADARKIRQRKVDQPGGAQDLAFRESAQDVAPVRGKANRGRGSRTPKTGHTK